MHVWLVAYTALITQLVGKMQVHVWHSMHLYIMGKVRSSAPHLVSVSVAGGDRTEAAASGSQAEGTGAQQHRDSISFSYRSAAQSGHLPSSADAQHPSPFVGITDASGMAPAGLDLSDPKQLLASAGLPADTVVVEPSYYMGGPQGPAAKDSTLNTRYGAACVRVGLQAPQSHQLQCLQLTLCWVQ